VHNDQEIVTECLPQADFPGGFVALNATAAKPQPKMIDQISCGAFGAPEKQVAGLLS
jgi:hypothetical protein